jgi:hypothetical protein
MVNDSPRTVPIESLHMVNDSPRTVTDDSLRSAGGFAAQQQKYEDTTDQQDRSDRKTAFETEGTAV